MSLPGKACDIPQQPELQINLAGLPHELRKPVWNWMLKHRPAICEWIQGDQCTLMRKTFNDIGCAPVLDLNEAEADELLTQFPGLTRYAI